MDSATDIPAANGSQAAVSTAPAANGSATTHPEEGKNVEKCEADHGMPNDHGKPQDFEVLKDHAPATAINNEKATNGHAFPNFEINQAHHDLPMGYEVATNHENNQADRRVSKGHETATNPETDQADHGVNMSHEAATKPEIKQAPHDVPIDHEAPTNRESSPADPVVSMSHEAATNPEVNHVDHDEPMHNGVTTNIEAKPTDGNESMGNGEITNPEAHRADHQTAIDHEDRQIDHGGPMEDEPAVNLEVDSDEVDSAIGDMEPVSSTASLRSSVFDVVEENGRTYHRYKEGKYLLPNDDDEQDRLDLQHHICLLSMNGRLHLAPTGDNLNNVLDLGTGTGIWAIEFALQHPDANIIGSDLSPIQPNFVPQNCRFEVDDAEDEWTYSHKFDLIHWRMLFSCFKDPAGVIAKAYDFLNPGGYLEIMDVILPLESVDDSLQNTALGDWCPKLIAGAKVLGKDWTCTSKFHKYMTDAGFVDIQVVKYQWPTNPWAKAPDQKVLGKWVQQNLLDGVSGMTMAALTRGLKMHPSEVELFLVDVRSDIKNRRIHAFAPVIAIYGRKPE